MSRSPKYVQCPNCRHEFAYKAKETVQCARPGCGKSYEVYPSRLKRGDQKYCSAECHEKAVACAAETRALVAEKVKVAALREEIRLLESGTSFNLFKGALARKKKSLAAAESRVESLSKPQRTGET